MKVVLVSTYERKGGAAIACYRLKEALLKEGVDVMLLTAYKTSDDPTVITPFDTRWKRLKNRFHFYKERFSIFIKNGFSRKNLFAVSIADSGTDISALPVIREADIIHLHWVNQGFLSLQNIHQLIKLGKPMVFTMHDMWYCTSICHHARSCDRFMSICRECPYLQYPGAFDLSYKVWLKKQFLRNPDIVFTSVSRWLVKRAGESVLMETNKIFVIPNVIDTEVFYPRDREKVRMSLGISDNSKVVVFGAAKLNDENKGFKLLKQSLKDSKYCREINLFLFGEIKRDKDFLKDIPCNYRYLGEIGNSEDLARIYSAADVTVMPSHYETFGQTLAESMACGTPVVAFNSSGQTDIIDHLENGYLVTYPFTSDFVEGMDWVLDHTNPEMRKKCIDKIKRCFSRDVIVRQYLDLYHDLFVKDQLRK